MGSCFSTQEQPIDENQVIQDFQRPDNVRFYDIQICNGINATIISFSINWFIVYLYIENNPPFYSFQIDFKPSFVFARTSNGFSIQTIDNLKTCHHVLTYQNHEFTTDENGNFLQIDKKSSQEIAEAFQEERNFPSRDGGSAAVSVAFQEERNSPSRDGGSAAVVVAFQEPESLSSGGESSALEMAFPSSYKVEEITSFSGQVHSFLKCDENTLTYLVVNTRYKVDFGIKCIDTLTIYEIQPGVYLIVISNDDGLYLSGYSKDDDSICFETTRLNMKLGQDIRRIYQRIIFQNGYNFSVEFNDIIVSVNISPIGKIETGEVLIKT